MFLCFINKSVKFRSKIQFPYLYGNISRNGSCKLYYFYDTKQWFFTYCIRNSVWVIKFLVSCMRTRIASLCVLVVWWSLLRSANYLYFLVFFPFCKTSGLNDGEILNYRLAMPSKFGVVTLEFNSSRKINFKQKTLLTTDCAEWHNQAGRHSPSSERSISIMRKWVLRHACLSETFKPAYLLKIMGAWYGQWKVNGADENSGLRFCWKQNSEDT